MLLTGSGVPIVVSIAAACCVRGWVCWCVLYMSMLPVERLAIDFCINFVDAVCDADACGDGGC